MPPPSTDYWLQLNKKKCILDKKMVGRQIKQSCKSITLCGIIGTVTCFMFVYHVTIVEVGSMIIIVPHIRENEKPVTTSSKSQEIPVQGNIKPLTPSTNVIKKQSAATKENYRRIEGEKRRLLYTYLSKITMNALFLVYTGSTILYCIS